MDEKIAYLEGKIAAVEKVCGMLLRATFRTDKSALKESVSQLSGLIDKDSEPEFKNGFEDSVERIIEQIEKTELV